MNEIPAIVEAIERYCAKHGIADTTFGRMAVNDGKLVGRLRDGRTITLDTLTKIQTFMQAPPPAAMHAAGDGEAAA